MSADAVVVLNTAAGPAHRRGLVADRARCGQRLLLGAVESTLLACQVHRVPVCAACHPIGGLHDRPRGTRR